MDTGLSGKKVLVTGSTAGLGFGIAEAFAQEGSRVIINSGTEKNVKAVVLGLQAKYTNAQISGITADLTKLGDVNRLYDQATRDGKLDILVNNVGICPVVPFAEITDEQWFHIFDVNVMSSVRLCRRALPDMLKANSGKIILISSEAGLRPNKEIIHYCMTKAALLNLARGMSMVLDWHRPVKIFIETKHPVRYGSLVESKVLALLHRFGIASPASADRSRAVVMSFSAAAVWRIRRAAPLLPTVLLGRNARYLTSSAATAVGATAVGPSLAR